MKTPKWIRCYDGGEKFADRYTVVFTRLGHIKRGYCFYRGMSAHPMHPQGVGMSGEHDGPIDRPAYAHLGKRIKFEDLPIDCQTVVRRDYRDFHPKEGV